MFADEKQIFIDFRINVVFESFHAAIMKTFSFDLQTSLHSFGATKSSFGSQSFQLENLKHETTYESKPTNFKPLNALLLFSTPKLNVLRC